MQKDEWRKKLAGSLYSYSAPGMNEAKEYDTIEQYHMRDDKKYKQRIEDTLRQVNVGIMLLSPKSRRLLKTRPRKKKGRNTLAKRKEKRPGRRPLRTKIAISTRKRTNG